MISDDKRREVAKKMREYDVAEFKESAIVPFLECLGHGYTDWRGILDELADLIDVPTTVLDLTETTRTVRGEEVHVWECRECGQSCEEMYGGYEYCPHCRRKVVVEDA